MYIRRLFVYYRSPDRNRNQYILREAGKSMHADESKGIHNSIEASQTGRLMIYRINILR